MDKLTVLYVDDDSYSLKLLKEQLKIANIDVIMVDNGANGFSSYEKYKNEIDIILLDINMPNVNGYELLHKFRSINTEIPIIMITSSNFIDKKNEIINLGATDFLIKPIACSKMIKTVKEYS